MRISSSLDILVLEAFMLVLISILASCIIFIVLLKYPGQNICKNQN